MNGWTVKRRSRGVYVWTPQIWRYVLLVRLVFPFPSLQLQRWLTDAEVERLLAEDA